MKNMMLIAISVLAIPATGYAQDASNWAGFYAGATATGVNANSSSMGVGGFFEGAPEEFSSLYDSAPQGAVSGIRAGYNLNLGSGWLAGVEGSLNFGAISGAIDDPVSANENDQITSKLDQSRKFTARIGYVAGKTLIYGRAGLANARTSISLDDETVLDSESLSLKGRVFGVGVEQMLTSKLGS